MTMSQVIQGGLVGLCYRDDHSLAQRDEVEAMLPAHPRLVERASVLVSKNVALGVLPSMGRLSGIRTREWNGAQVHLAFHGTLYETSRFPGSHSDVLTAVLEQFCRHGTAVLAHLRGEFHLAVYVEADRELLVATDRFRIHPIVYRLDPDKVVFASTLTALYRGHARASWSINPAAVVRLVASYVIPTPETIYQEASKLPPASVLSITRSRVAVTDYWDVPSAPDNQVPSSERMRQLRETFEEAMAVRLAGDGPGDHLGTFLSGGVDSSTVTGVMTQLLGRPVKSFSIGFAEEKYDELSYARLVAEHYRSRHYVHLITPEETMAILEALALCFDEPYGNSSAVGAYYCAQLAQKQGVTCLYAGDGGDELFAGNKRYAKQKLYDYYTAVPAWLRTGVIEPWLLPLLRRGPLAHLQKLARYIDHARVPYPERLAAHSVYEFIPETSLFHPDFLAGLPHNFHPDDLAFRWYRTAPGTTPLDRQLYVDLKMVISDNDVIKVARTAESVGIEVRFPFLDHRVVEYAMTIPAAVKMPGLRLRAFFKEAYRDLLPEAVRTKPKHGFGLPMPVWLRTYPPLRDMLHDLVLSPRAIQRGYFQRPALERLIRLHESEPSGFYGAVLWNIMALELWHRVRNF